MRWFKIAAVTLLVIGIFHLAGHFIIIPGMDPAHNALLPVVESPVLMALKNRSTQELVAGFSLWYSLLFCWIGLVCILMSNNKSQPGIPIIKLTAFVNAVASLAGSLISFRYFFWYPAASTLVAFLFFSVAYFQLAKSPH